MNNKLFFPYVLLGMAILAEENSVIGKRIRVCDNSYINQLNTCVNSHQDLYGKEFIIISEPYMKQVHTTPLDLRIFGEKYVKMVKVKSPRTGFEYETMFVESWIVD